MDLLFVLLVVFLPLTTCLPAKTIWRPTPGVAAAAAAAASSSSVASLALSTVTTTVVTSSVALETTGLHQISGPTPTVAFAAPSSSALVERFPAETPDEVTPAGRRLPLRLKLWYDLLAEQLEDADSPHPRKGPKMASTLSHDELVSAILYGPAVPGESPTTTVPAATPSSSLRPRAPEMISTHDYTSMLFSAPNNPPVCGMSWASLDLSRVTAMEHLALSDCGTCLEICGAAGCADVLAIDRGGKGLDLSTGAKARVLGAENDIGEATWREVDQARCRGVWSGEMFLEGDTPPGKLRSLL